MTVFVLTLVLFLQGGVTVVDSVTEPTNDVCTAAAPLEVKTMLGKRLLINGEKLIVLDAQAHCSAWDQHDNA